MPDIKPCTQERCSFHRVHGEKNAMLCPICDDCGCESNVIDEDCTNCWNCLKDEGYVRSGVPKFVKETVQEMIDTGQDEAIVVMEQPKQIEQVIRK